MIEGLLDALAVDLSEAGVRGRARKRVLDEARDHLGEAAAKVGEADAVQAFGSPASVARLVAAELATASTRRATLATFGVLGVAGLAYAVLFLTLPLAGSPDAFGGGLPAVGLLAFAGVIFAPQIAFVSGCLALVRVTRLRRRGALPERELRVQRWRTGIALAAGLVTLVSLAVAALDFLGDLAGWWVAAALATACALAPPLGATGVAILRSSRVRALREGRAEDVFDDFAFIQRLPVLPRLDLPTHPWRFALLVGGVAALGVEMAGIAVGDPYDGLVRAFAELLAVLGCFALLGRPLGLRRC